VFNHGVSPELLAEWLAQLLAEWHAGLLPKSQPGMHAINPS
jgi:hypothetical protein